ncbi:MAG: hypothetical protein FWG04_02880 [Desulfovibrionaceae bacterium]|nr:hypothetical protein [Desulfovibrionaceae bacterium]
MSDRYLTIPTLIRGRLRKATLGAQTPRMYRGTLLSPTADIREELLTNSRQPEIMLRFLAEMDRKLDAVLSLLQSESLAQEFPEEGHIVELSGQGLVLECNAELSTGSYIELLLRLEEYPIRMVSTLSRVERPRPVAILPDMHSHAYDVTYTSIAEEDREAVIRFVFSEERKRIRQSKGDM